MGFLFRCNLCGAEGTETWVREEAEEEEAQHREAEPSHFEHTEVVSP